MVSTRGQTGKLPGANKPNYVEASDSEGEEHEDEQFSAPRGRPPPKRQKTMANSKKDTNLKRRRGGKLSMLPDLPLDILFEVFSALSPKDLVALSRTNKMVRQTLTQPQAVTVWKESRKTINMPDPRYNFTECGWASLIFGGTSCQVCGTYGVKRVDWALLRRVCTNCLKKNLFWERHFTKTYPKENKWILEYLAYTDIGPNSQGHSTHSRFFWHNDVVSKLREFEEQEALYGDDSEEYKAKQQESQRYVSERLKFSGICRKFMYDYENAPRLLHQRLCSERKQMIVDRFVALGFHSNDVSSIRALNWGEQSNIASPLTDLEFSTLRPQLEDDIHRSRRLRIHRDPSFQTRRSIFSALYTSWKAQCPSADWRLLPPVGALIGLSLFDSVMFSEPSVPVSNSSFDAIMAELLQISSSAVQSRLQVAREESQTLKELQFPVSPEQLTQLTALPDSDCLELAVYIVSTESPFRGNGMYWYGRGIILGYDGIVHHIDGPNGYDCQPGKPNAYGPEDIFPQFTLSKIAAFFSAQLVTSVGKSIASTTGRDMDELDARFVCNQCKMNKKILEIYNWRGMVTHLSMNHYHKSTNGLDSQGQPLASLLTPEEDAKARAIETPEPQHRQLVWGCLHCAIHLDNWKSRQDVFDHLTSSHAVTSPRYNIDFMLAPGHQLSGVSRCSLEFTKPKPPPRATSGAGVGNPSVKEYLCNQCPSSKRLFDVGGVKNHIEAKHRINKTEIIVDVHYKKA